MKEKGRNTWFLPDLELSPELQLHANPMARLCRAKVFLLVVPSQFMRASLENFRDILPQEAHHGLRQRGHRKRHLGAHVAGGGRDA